MKLFWTSAIAAALSLLVATTHAGKPVNIQVTLRGKKYSIPNVSTVSQLQATVESVTGLVTGKQSLLYNGQKLKPDDERNDELEGYGIEDGSVINVVPVSSKGGKKKSSSVASTSAADVLAEGDVVSSPSSSSSTNSGLDIDKLMEQAGVDKSKLEELMKDIPGMENGQLPDLKESMNMMKDLTSNPMFQEMLTDPERLEQSRQMILNNPLMKSMMSEMPGFEELLNDKEKWRDSMIAAANMYKDLSPEMMESMFDGLKSGLNGEIPDLGSASLGIEEASAALDELSEGDE